MDDETFWAKCLADGRPFREIVLDPGIYFDPERGWALPEPPPGYDWVHEEGGLQSGDSGLRRLWPKEWYPPGGE